jgi:ribonuclease P protein component
VAPGEIGSQRLPRPETLRKSADFQGCYREGRRRHGALATLYSRPNTLSAPRLGITASRKVGGAVVRNRLKRWVRETYRRGGSRAALPPVDLVVHLKPEAATAPFAAFRSELERLLGEVGGRRR